MLTFLALQCITPPTGRVRFSPTLFMLQMLFVLQHTECGLFRERASFIMHEPFKRLQHTALGRRQGTNINHFVDSDKSSVKIKGTNRLKGRHHFHRRGCVCGAISHIRECMLSLRVFMWLFGPMSDGETAARATSRGTEE